MHDDDERRFPRITLWELLGGISAALFKGWLFGPQVWIEPDPGPRKQESDKGDPSDPPPPDSTR